MIGTFKSKVLKALWQRGRAKGIDPKSADSTILDLLDQAIKPDTWICPALGFTG